MRVVIVPVCSLLRWNEIWFLRVYVRKKIRLGRKWGGTCKVSRSKWRRVNVTLLCEEDGSVSKARSWISVACIALLACLVTMLTYSSKGSRSIFFIVGGKATHWFKKKCQIFIFKTLLSGRMRQSTDSESIFCHLTFDCLCVYFSLRSTNKKKFIFMNLNNLQTNHPRTLCIKCYGIMDNDSNWRVKVQ